MHIIPAQWKNIKSSQKTRQACTRTKSAESNKGTYMRVYFGNPCSAGYFYMFPMGILFVCLMDWYFLNLFLFKLHFFHLYYIPTSFASLFSFYPLSFPSIPLLIYLFHLHSERDRTPMGLHTAWNIKVRKDQVPPLVSRQGKVIQQDDQVTKSQLSIRERSCTLC